MAIENVTGQRVPPAAALVAEIDKRRASFSVQASGLGPVLDVLRAYIVATDARITELENRPAVQGVMTRTEYAEAVRQR